MLNIFKKKKVKLSSSPPIENGGAVNIFDKDGEKIKKDAMGDKERRMAEVLDTLNKAGKTGRYLVCITIHDPQNKMKKNSGDLHHFTFQQDFPTPDIYGCLDEFATLMKLGDK